MRFDAYSYAPLAFVYDELAWLYSFGQIAKSKRVQLGEIAPGARVLYAGVGRGEDALLAARFGAEVTAIDLAPGMLRRFKQKLDREGLSATLVEGDVASHAAAEEEGAYDVVVANYFLNLFDADKAREMLAHLVRLTKADGQMLFADFARPRGGVWAEWVCAAHYRPANWIAWAFGFCELHPILDYGELLAGFGFEIRKERRLPLLFGQNPAYVSITAQRIGAPQPEPEPPSPAEEAFLGAAGFETSD
ncbi:MAG: class I SAM-dependent methyltransferase [Myxococcota bacterium]